MTNHGIADQCGWKFAQWSGYAITRDDVAKCTNVRQIIFL